MTEFHDRVLDIDAAAVAGELTAVIERQIVHRLKRQGAVVGVSGGIDSSTVVALCCKAMGPERVVGVAMPERDSNPESLALARELSAKFGFSLVVEDMTPPLAGLGCYPRRDEAVKRVVPDYTPDCRFAIVLPGDLLERERLNIFRLSLTYPDGRKIAPRIPPKEYLQIVAASNMKQRSRMLMLYYHAEMRNYAVAGTGNKNEHDQGFFVKWGDGGADLKPIAHLYKTQVFALAAALGIPQSVLGRTPTTDTYTAEQTQEDFYYSLPFPVMDRLHWAQAHGCDAAQVAKVMKLTVEQVERVWRDFDRKFGTTEYLRAYPLHADE